MDSKYGILFVRLFGELTKKTRKKFNKEVFDLLINIGVKNVVFNLENVYKMDDSGYKNLIKCYNISSKNNGNSMICLNKNKSNYDLKSLNIVKDELSACHLINS